MKKDFRKDLLRSLHGGNFFLLWGLSDFCALYDSRVLEWEDS